MHLAYELRWLIFRRLSALPRHPLEVTPSFLELPAFESMLGLFGAGEIEEIEEVVGAEEMEVAEDALVSDSDEVDEEETVCHEKVLTLRGLQQASLG